MVDQNDGSGVREEGDAPRKQVALVFDVAHPDGYGLMVPRAPVFWPAHRILKRAGEGSVQLSTRETEAFQMGVEAVIEGRERIPVPASPVSASGGGEPVSMSAFDLIGAERKRQQTDEGWSLEHDDAHVEGELATAASVYAFSPPRPFALKKMWPWERTHFKPTPVEREAPHCECRSVGECQHVGEATDRAVRAARIRDLTKAGALIVAEIERLQRLDRRGEAIHVG